MLPQPHKTTPEEQAVMNYFAELMDLPEHPADIRERMRAKLDALPAAARAVYNRDNIRSPKTPLMAVVETVLYHFDLCNRQRVAVALGMDYTEMVTLLIGYVLGKGE